MEEGIKALAVLRKPQTLQVTRPQLQSGFEGWQRAFGVVWAFATASRLNVPEGERNPGLTLRVAVIFERRMVNGRALNGYS